MSCKSIQPGELQRSLQAGQKLWLVDVRTPAEFEAAHLREAYNHPLSALGLQKLEPPADCAGTLYLVCQSGARARQAATRLQQAGQAELCLLEGGMNAWQAAGLPVIRDGSQLMSLERQVRIAAGLLILLGVVLNRLGLDNAIYLSAVVGLGLTLAGITEWCGMSPLLARMPWNQGRRAGEPVCF